MSYYPLLSAGAGRVALSMAMLAIGIVAVSSTRAAENELTPKEISDGWKLLFNGRNFDGWKNNGGQPVGAKIEDGAINVHGTGGQLLVYEKPLGDFVFKCDVKMEQPDCNSGIFVRTGDLQDPVQTGIEVQVASEVEPSLHSFGAIYDLVAPTKNATRGAGKWDSVKVRCKGPKITVTVNGKKTTSMNCDEWDQPGKRLDGSSHKFTNAIREFPRKGFIGLQDHGHDVWYKNIKMREL